jgi:signal transduction histidine kinase
MAQFDRLKHNPEQINLESIFKESFITFNDVLETKDIKIVPANINVSLYADKNMIRIVLRNLLSNAIKFSHLGVLSRFSQVYEE